MNPENVLLVLGVASKEDVVTNLIAYCLERDAHFASAFLNRVCEIPERDITIVGQPLKRFDTGESGIPDLVVLAKANNRSYLVVVENKLKAGEGEDQTERYGAPECISRIRQRLVDSGHDTARDARETLIFLTLFPDEKPKSNRFIHKTYKNLLAATEDLPMLSGPLAGQLWFDFRNLLIDFYDHGMVSDNDILIEKLGAKDDPLEGGYLYFKRFVDKLQLESGLELEYSFRSSRQGRRYYGALFSKSDWHPEEMHDDGKHYELDALRNFNVHFEPQYSLFQGQFSVFLHYETNPYLSVKDIKRYTSSVEYEQYLSVREKFKNLLKKKGIPGFLICGGSNQIAKAKLDVNGMTVADARNNITNLINKAAIPIDEGIRELVAQSEQ